MKILGIETSCDEVAAAIVEKGKNIQANIVKTTAPIHKNYGGVFPELASRGAINLILPAITEALDKAKIKITDIDLIAVTKGPGLIGSLLIGINTAKTLSMSLGIPFIGIDHIHAHLYAAMMQKNKPLVFPSLGVVLSGGHTFLVKISAIGKYQCIGATIDDAIGEAFDKVGSLLDLPYPAGPYLEKLAKKGDETKYLFQAGKVKKDPYAFSFSGLKTSVLYTVKGPMGKKRQKSLVAEEEKKHIAASFQKTAFNDVINKSKKALIEHDLKAVYLGGGVCANQALRKYFLQKLPDIPQFFAPIDLCTDNAAMIAGLAYHKFLERPYSDPLDLQACTQTSISN